MVRVMCKRDIRNGKRVIKAKMEIKKVKTKKKNGKKKDNRVFYMEIK
jgi:hypothetical protein